MKINTKKGVQLNQAFGAILALVLVAVLVIVAIVMFDSIGSTFTDEAQSVSNESIALNNATNVTLAGAADCNFGDDVSVSEIYKGGLLVTEANYTSYPNGNVILAGAETDGTSLVTYTYTNGGASCTATENMITQFSAYPVLIGLVGTIIFLGLVIGVLVASFAFSGRRV